MSPVLECPLDERAVSGLPEGIAPSPLIWDLSRRHGMVGTIEAPDGRAVQGAFFVLSIAPYMLLRYGVRIHRYEAYDLVLTDLEH